MIGKKINMDSYDKQTQQIIVEAARRIASYVLTKLKDIKLLFQKLVLEKTFDNIHLQSFLP